MGKPSSLEFALLGALALSAQSGYDLRKMMADTPMRHYSDSPGSIYPALQRLKARKWARVQDDKASARGRAVFQITPAGKTALLAWLQEPIGRADVVHRIDMLLLRFALFDGNLSRKHTRTFLDDLERQVGDYVTELETYAEGSGISRSINTGALAFSHGLDGYRALLAWTKRAKAKLAKVT